MRMDKGYDSSTDKGLNRRRKQIERYLLKMRDNSSTTNPRPDLKRLPTETVTVTATNTLGNDLHSDHEHEDEPTKQSALSDMASDENTHCVELVEMENGPNLHCVTPPRTPTLTPKASVVIANE